MQFKTINAQRNKKLSPERWIHPLTGLSKIKINEQVCGRFLPLEAVASSTLQLMMFPQSFTSNT